MDFSWHLDCNISWSSRVPQVPQTWSPTNPGRVLHNTKLLSNGGGYTNQCHLVSNIIKGTTSTHMFTMFLFRSMSGMSGQSYISSYFVSVVWPIPCQAVGLKRWNCDFETWPTSMANLEHDQLDNMANSLYFLGKPPSRAGLNYPSALVYLFTEPSWKKLTRPVSLQWLRSQHHLSKSYKYVHFLAVIAH